MWDRASPLPDGTRFVRATGVFPMSRGVTIRDARSGEVLTELEGTWTYESTFENDLRRAAMPSGTRCSRSGRGTLWSPDGKAIVAVNDMRDAAGGFVVWNATDGSARFGDPIKVRDSASFTPDGPRWWLRP